MSDHMKEAERLMRQYTTAVLEQNYEAIALYHFTLLAHIQRGAVPEGRQVVPMPEPVARILEWRGRLALSPQPSARTFDEFPTSETFPAKKDAYWSDGKLLVLADEARTYGDAREAAGYARGRAEAGRDAERYRWLTQHAYIGECFTDDGVVFEVHNTDRQVPIDGDVDAAIDAALRGEVKP